MLILQLEGTFLEKVYQKRVIPKNCSNLKLLVPRKSFYCATFVRCIFSELFLQIWIEHTILAPILTYFQGGGGLLLEVTFLIWTRKYEICNIGADNKEYFVFGLGES
jgi:hypothetical protein